ncbi:hypothetical protein FSHL1_003893 [Fusarium sambucinum]
MTESLNFEAGEGDATNHQKRYWGANPIDAYIVSSDGKMHFWPSTIQAMKRRKAIMEWYSRHKFEPIWADTQLTSAYHLAMRQCEGDFNKLPVHRSDYVDENKYKIDMDINYDTEFYHLPTDRYATTTTDVESFGLAKQNRPKIVRFKSAVQGHHWDEMSDDKNGFPPPGNPELEYLYTSIAYGFDIVLMSPLDKDQAVRGTLRVSESGYKEFRTRVRLFKGKHRDFPLEASPREGYHWFPLDWECFEQFSAHQMKVEIEPLTGKIKELKHYDMPSDRLCWFSSKDIYEAFYRLNKEAFNPTVPQLEAFRTGDETLDSIIQAYCGKKAIVSAEGIPLSQDWEEKDVSDWYEKELRPRKGLVSAVAPPDLDYGFGTSDIGLYLQRAKQQGGVWDPDDFPTENEWWKIRHTGSSGKRWGLDMAIEAAFQEFRICGASVDLKRRRILNRSPQCEQLKEVIVHIRSHFDSLTKRGGSNSAFMSKVVKDTLLARKKMYLTGGTQKEVKKVLPSGSKVLACTFVTTHNTLNATLAGALLLCGRFYDCYSEPGQVETPGAPNTTLDNAQSTVTTQPKPGLVLTDEEKCLEGLNNKIEGLSNQLEGYTSGQAKQTADFNQKLADAEKLKSDLGQQLADTEKLKSDLGQKLADTEKLKSDLGQKLADTEKLAGKQAQHLRNTETMVSEQAQRLNNAENLASEQGQVLNDSKQLVNEQAQRIADTEKLAGKQAKQFIDTKKLVDEQAQRLADAEKLKEGYSQKVEEAKTFVERLEQAEKKTDDRIQKLDQEVENVKSMARKLTSNSNSPAQRKSGGRSPSGPISSPSRTPGGQVRSHFTTPDNPRPRRVSGPGNSGSPLAGKMGKKRESSGTLSPTAQRPKRPRSGKDTIEEGSPEDEYEEVLKGIMS